MLPDNRALSSEQQLSQELLERMRKRRCFADKDLEEVSIAHPARFQQSVDLRHHHHHHHQNHSSSTVELTHHHHHQSNPSPPYSVSSDSSVNFMDTLNRLAAFYAQFLTAPGLDDQRNSTAFLFANLVAQMNSSNSSLPQTSGGGSHSLPQSTRSSPNLKVPLKKRELCVPLDTQDTQSEFEQSIDEISRNMPIGSVIVDSSVKKNTGAAKLTNFSVEALLSGVK